MKTVEKVASYLYFALLFLIFSLVSFPSCGRDDPPEPSGDVVESNSILYISPTHKSRVFPQDISIYVLLSRKPEIKDIRFLVWREGQGLPGIIDVIEEKEGNKRTDYKVVFTPIEMREGTYIVFFSWAGESTFWTFSAEITKEIPEFFPSLSPPPGEKNFPLESSIFISPSSMLNIETLDRETIKLYKVIGGGNKVEIPYEIEYFPNSIIIWPGERIPSTTYYLEITDLVIFPSGNPELFHEEIDFRTIDVEKPFIRTCSPDFCIRQGDCSKVKDEFADAIEITFGEREELDPVSVSENLIIYIENNSEGWVKKVGWKNVFKVFGNIEIVETNQVAEGEFPAELFVFPSKVLVRLTSDLSPDMSIKIYMLPEFSDSSGNTIDEFFFWCVDVVN